METTKKLETRHWDFYRIVNGAGQNGIGIMSLAERMGIKTERMTDMRYMANTSAYRLFHKLKEEINNSGEVDKIIVIGPDYAYRVATQKEAIELYERYESIARDYHVRAAFIKKKIYWDGQGKIVNNQLNEMKDTDKQFHETYLEESHGE